MSEYVTIDGYNPTTEKVIPLINIWKNWTQRKLGTAGTVRHGTRVELMERKGQRIKIRHNGITGFVTYYFIREFKQGMTG